MGILERANAIIELQGYLRLYLNIVPQISDGDRRDQTTRSSRSDGYTGNGALESHILKASLYASCAYLLGVVEEVRAFPSDWRIKAEQLRQDLVVVADATNGNELLADLRALREQFEAIHLAEFDPSPARSTPVCRGGDQGQILNS
jgi:hypothetical protein